MHTPRSLWITLFYYYPGLLLHCTGTRNTCTCAVSLKQLHRYSGVKQFGVLLDNSSATAWMFCSVDQVEKMHPLLLQLLLCEQSVTLKYMCSYCVKVALWLQKSNCAATVQRCGYLGSYFCLVLICSRPTRAIGTLQQHAIRILVCSKRDYVSGFT